MSESQNDCDPVSSQYFQDIGDLETSDAQQHVTEKKELSNLNHRLEMFVRHQRDSRNEISRLRKALVDTEVDLRQRLKDAEKRHQIIQDKIMAENEQLSIQNKTLQDQLETTEKAYQSSESRRASLDEKVTCKMTEIELKDQQLEMLQNQLEALTNELITVKSSVKLMVKNDEHTAEHLQAQCDQWKNKFDVTCEELAKVTYAFFSFLLQTLTPNIDHCFFFRNEDFGKFSTKKKKLFLNKCLNCNIRSFSDKLVENEKLKEQLNESTTKFQDMEDQLRKEFDVKMLEVWSGFIVFLFWSHPFVHVRTYKKFTQKRESQYQNEKEEWIKMFKEEFQKKLAHFKEENAQYLESNKKLECEIVDTKARLARVRREKLELEAEKRSLVHFLLKDVVETKGKNIYIRIFFQKKEEEVEKSHSDVNELRQKKDEEIHEKTESLRTLNDTIRQKDIQYQQLSSAKVQLDNEIA
ncbi:hypothetical protein RFI_12779, partial [Reticulomyxa filosa]